MRTSRNSRSEKFSFLSFLVARSGPSKLTPQGVCTPVGENCSSEGLVGRIVLPEREGVKEIEASRWSRGL